MNVCKHAEENSDLSTAAKDYYTKNTFKRFGRRDKTDHIHRSNLIRSLEIQHSLPALAHSFRAKCVCHTSAAIANQTSCLNNILRHITEEQ